jgi:hypothetical protein
MRRVFSMEPEGMTKFCDRKVRMKRPTTRTEQMLARASKGVSAAFSSAATGTGLAGGTFFFDILAPTGCFRAISTLRVDCSQSGSGTLARWTFAVKLSGWFFPRFLLW